ncbi:MAG TPA: hypothetical protein VFM54_13835 [Micromonosporaceae bacterium]|nr:hypothetical protein [Micromonosporaceae bacterium]
MSDFDTVLERLLTDPAFAAALATDRSAALSGYHLAPDEIALLSAQLGGDQGGQHAVEARESKASIFGLLAPLVEASGLGTGARGGIGAVGHGEHSGPGPVGQGGRSGYAQGFGAGPGVVASEGFGAGPGAASEGFGAGPAAVASEGFGAGPAAPASEGFGARPGAPASGRFGAPAESTGKLVDDGFGAAPTQADLPTGPPPAGYHTRVDIDGDGRWDAHAYRARADGGVDIVADLDRDGRADFVGRDYDRDGLVDAADYDKDRDGHFETRMFDDDRDGWMDRKTVS